MHWLDLLILAQDDANRNPVNRESPTLPAEDGTAGRPEKAPGLTSGMHGAGQSDDHEQMLSFDVEVFKRLVSGLNLLKTNMSHRRRKTRSRSRR